MSHHVTATAQNPSGAVEVVHVHSASATSAPVDLGSTGAGGLAKAQTTGVEGITGTRGANLPVDGIEQASTTIERGKADLARTTGAERRLDGFNGVGGGGGGGGASAGQQNAGNATGAVAQGTANENVGQSGLGGDTSAAGQTLTGLPDTDVRSVAP